jgi:hypothetical protein
VLNRKKKKGGGDSPTKEHEQKNKEHEQKNMFLFMTAQLLSFFLVLAVTSCADSRTPTAAQTTGWI